MSLEAALEALRGAKRVSGTRASYAKDNPNEWLTVESYLDGGPRPSGVEGFTLMGKGLCLVEDVRRGTQPEPEPPSGTGELGICLNKSPSSAWLAKAASLNPKWCREDTITQTKIDWAKANGVKFIGLCNLARTGLATAKAKVDQWGSQITHWELDNEPYFDGVVVTTWANQALELAKYVRGKYPTHEIILPMLVQTNGGDYMTNGVWSPWAFQVLNAAPTLPNYINAISGHPYQPGKAPTTVFATMDKVRGQLVSRGVSDPWHMTEFGWSVGTDETPPNTQTTLTEQAQFLKDIIVGMRTRPWIVSMEVYCLMTWGTDYEASFGLFNQDMSERPAAGVFRSLA